ncbi:TPA: TatD family hydrolase, partial [Staphylococcus aureus]|nr:TatD family hydrolase [Staphylococcus aureus]
PARVKLVAEQIAELRGISYEEVCKATTENAERLFKL